MAEGGIVANIVQIGLVLVLTSVPMQTKMSCHVRLRLGDERGRGEPGNLDHERLCLAQSKV